MYWVNQTVQSKQTFSNVVVRRRGGEVFYSPTSSYEPRSLSCKLHQCFSIFFFFFTPLGGVGRLEWAGVGCFPSPRFVRI